MFKPSDTRNWNSVCQFGGSYPNDTFSDKHIELMHDPPKMAYFNAIAFNLLSKLSIGS